MPDLSEFLATKTLRPSRCKVGELPPEILEQVEAQTSAFATYIAEWLMGEGYRMPSQYITRHRRGQCVCG